MRNDEHGETGTFDYPAPNGQEMDAHIGTLDSPETPLHETMTHELSVVAAQLVEAACKARDGDREATSAHIAHAVVSRHGRRAESSHTWKPIYAKGFPFWSSPGSWASAQATSAAHSNARLVFHHATMCCAGASR